VFVFPLGAIIMRVVPGRFTVWIHAATQVIGYAAFIAAAGLGIYLTQYVRIPGRDGTLVSRTDFREPMQTMEEANQLTATL
jgi:hypothetical protein